MSQSCANDEGGPLGISFQERVSNHSKLLRPKGVVVSVGPKAQGRTSKKQKPSRPSFEPGWRKSTYPNVKFDFLGYCFRPRWIKKSRDNSMFCGFNPAVSPSALKAMRSTIRDLNIRRQTQLSLADIARTLNPLVRGWIEYYGRYAPSALSPMLRYVNQTLVRWAMRKFKRFKAHKIRASRFLQKLVRERMSLFVHWRIGMTGTFA